MLQPQRRLAAILAADVVGYSRLMESYEQETHDRLMHLRRDLIDPEVVRQKGTIVKNTGDGFLAIFESAKDATRCAVTLQQQVTKETVDQPLDQRISFRMALNAADVIVEPDDVYGDGVNVAARLQSYAQSGGIVVSGAVAEQVDSNLGVTMVDLGDVHLRNLKRPVRVFSLQEAMAPPKLLGDHLSGDEQRPSIAVLPFRKRMRSPDERYFVDGMVDDIIRGLAAIKELFVVSRGSALSYSGDNVDVRSVGRDLGVRYVLYGSALRSGRKLRIGTEFSDAETGNVIRSDQYDGDVGDLFSLQDRIAVSVVKAIAPQVRERELRRALRKHPQNMTAYDLVLQALDLLYRMDFDSFSRARGLLEQAISYDPTYSAAYSYISLWYTLRVGEIGSPDPQADAQAGAHYAAEAVNRDGDDAFALAIHGHTQAFLLHNFARAASILERAIEAGPSSAMAWSMGSATSGFLGDGPTAVQRGERGVRLSPMDARSFWHEGLLAQAHYVNGDYEQALDWAQSAVARNELVRFTARTLIATHMALDRKADAEQVARHLMRIQPDFRLSSYAKRCPFQGTALDLWLARLRSAGLPD